MMVLEVLRVESFAPAPRGGRGRPPEDRRCLLRAFVAKSFLGLGQTKDLVELLGRDECLAVCVGYRGCAFVPSESSFSRAFAEFARSGVADKVHSDVLARFASGSFAISVGRDSTAIEVRERPSPRPEAPLSGKRRPGRRPKGTPPPEKGRLERQREQSWPEAVADLPTRCDVGVKHNSKGRVQYWTGFKLHVDVAEDGLPLAALTTSASLHDTQAAIPLSKMSNERCFGCYKLMDKAYWARPILEFERSLGSVPIVPAKRTRAGEPPPLDPDRRERFKDRTVAERFNSRLKECFGGRSVRVRGHAKVHLHLMLGVLTIAALVILGR